jgi:hypothetical protein
MTMLKSPLQLIRFSVLSLLIIASFSAYSQAILTKVGSSFPMFNGADLSAWTKTGNASWQIANNELSVSQGSGMLISRLNLPDYIIEFDYWVSVDAQASMYFHCTNPNTINAETAYEVSLANKSNGVGAGSIQFLSKVKPNQVANQWNHIQISAIGNQISVSLNGIVNQVTDARFSAGLFAINYQAGELRLKNINVTIPGRW